MKVPFVNLQLQHNSIKHELAPRLEEIFSNADFVLGKDVAQFEQEFAEYCDVAHCVGVNSGTDALFLALKALGLSKGDEVITAANTFLATVEAIENAGCRPVLVDVLPDTYNLDPAKIKDKITGKTKAIIPVHLYGQPAHMDPILEVAKGHNLFVVEDAAQAHGAMYKGRKIGSLGDLACFSFYPAKNLGAYGDAGAVLANNEEIAVKVKRLRNHGGIAKDQHDMSGYNSRLDSIQAAVLMIKLKYLSKWNEMRRENACIYNELLAKVPGVVTPQVQEGITHVYHLYVIRLEAGNRDHLMEYLKGKGIVTGIHYPKPVHLVGAFQHLAYKEGDFPVAEECTKKIISLPMHPELRPEQIAYVVQEIKHFMKGKVL